MDATAQLAEQQIRRGIAGEPEVDKEAVLERVGLYVHLLIAEAAADLDVVLAANHVKRVGNLKHVGAALEGSESAIAQRPVIVHQGGAHTTTHAVFGGLRRNPRWGIRALAVEVCAQDADVGRLASSVTKRPDVIEDSVIAKSELVDIPATENVGL